MIKSLKYPDDRFNGHVQLTDGSGNIFITDFSRCSITKDKIGDALKFSGAFLVISHRLDKINL